MAASIPSSGVFLDVHRKRNAKRSAGFFFSSAQHTERSRTVLVGDRRLIASLKTTNVDNQCRSASRESRSTDCGRHETTIKYMVGARSVMSNSCECDSFDRARAGQPFLATCAVTCQW